VNWFSMCSSKAWSTRWWR